MGNGLSVKVGSHSPDKGDLWSCGDQLPGHSGRTKKPHATEQILEARVDVKAFSRQKR